MTDATPKSSGPKSSGKTADRRERQRAALILTAEAAIAARGLEGLKTRDIASEINISLGAIYNLVGDLDDLVLLVASRTLEKLDVMLSRNGDRPPGRTVADTREATDRLVEIALAYRRFASENTNLWRVLFEYRMKVGKPVPDWAVNDQMRLFRHVTRPLEALVPGMDDIERMLTARTLFSAVHGVITLGLDEKRIAVPLPMLDRQLGWLVRLICRGLLGSAAS